MRPDFDFQRPNVYGAAWGSLSKRSVCAAYGKAGWHTRKSGWDEFEIYNDFSDMAIESNDGDMLIHGFLKDPLVNYRKLADVLASVGMNWSFEIYDQNMEMIAEYNSIASSAQQADAPDPGSNAGPASR